MTDLQFCWWFDALRLKREKVKGDPELFSVSRTIFAEAREVVAQHVDNLVGQLETILADGIASGDFRPVDSRATAVRCSTPRSGSSIPPMAASGAHRMSTPVLTASTRW